MAARIEVKAVLLMVVMMILAVLVLLPRSGADDSMVDSPQYLNSFAVQVHGGMREAQAVAADLGFIVQRELRNIGVFLLEHPTLTHRSRRSADDHLSRLQAHPKVHYAQQEIELKRVKRGGARNSPSMQDAAHDNSRVKRSIVHDKQMELPIREIKDNSVFQREKLSRVSQRGLQDEVVFNDPYYNDMWYLKNLGQSGGEMYLDMNVQVAWANGFTGQGVVVCILDDGVDHTHPDLVSNYDPKASADLNDKSDKMNDPMPNMTKSGNGHGTRCAGEIAAAANNNVCGVGVAYDAKIGGIRILDGSVTDSLEGEALSFSNDYVHVYSASWGPNDDGLTMEAPNYLASQALRNGVQKGRGGLGNIFVWATGNGGMHDDDCNADGYTSSIETLSVGSITDMGRQPFYMENCTSTLAVVPTGGEEYRGQEGDLGHIKLKVVTTDAGGGCIENFQGTSSAAPLAAGCIANVLQANPQLTWRDVQHLVVHATRITSVDSSWTINGAGHHVSHKFGFGLLDCGHMVQLAQDWKNVPEQHICQYSSHAGPIKIGYGGVVTDKLFVDACKGDSSRWIQRLEHVQVYLKMNTRRRGDTNIFLVSPAGTRSELLSQRRLDSFQGDWEFTFMTVHSWDENPEGTWQLEIHDRPREQAHGELEELTAFMDSSAEDSGGYLKKWMLTLYGTAGERYSRDFSSRQVMKKAYHPTEEALKRMKRDETESAQKVQVKRASATKRQNKRTNLNGQALDMPVEEALAKRLSDLLEQEEGRKYEKQIMEEDESAAAEKEEAPINGIKNSGKYDQAEPGESHSDTFQDQRLMKILRRLERLLRDDEQ